MPLSAQNYMRLFHIKNQNITFPFSAFHIRQQSGTTHHTIPATESAN